MASIGLRNQIDYLFEHVEDVKFNEIVEFFEELGYTELEIIDATLMLK